MTLPTMPRLQAVDLVEAALLKIDGEVSGEYRFNVKAVGLRDGLASVQEVTPDLCPWLFVFGGDSSTDERDVSFGNRQIRMDVVIWAILKPDPIRWRGKKLRTIQEWLVGDIHKALELYASSLPCGSKEDERTNVVIDPHGQYVIQEYVVTYKLKGNLGS